MSAVGRMARLIPTQDLEVGAIATLAWHAREAEIDAFAALSGDENPLHMSGEFATGKGFKGRVAHGFLLGAKVSALVGMLLPGENCLILEQSLAYPAPVYPGDDVEIVGEVEQLSSDKSLVRVKIRARKTNGDKPMLVGRGYVLCRNQ